MVGHAAAQLAAVDDVEIMVGGLPRERRWPFDYKAGFAPADVIEEYVRPARMVERGRVVTKEALSEPELLDFPGVGTLEAFNTDGLRSLALHDQRARHAREDAALPGPRRADARVPRDGLLLEGARWTWAASGCVRST